MVKEIDDHKETLSEFEDLLGQTEKIFRDMRNKEGVSDEDRKILEDSIKAYDDIKLDHFKRSQNLTGIPFSMCIFFCQNFDF